ncbi:hypothetical protein HYH02_004590 [Chlamydomonas schloesseri]|uniref:Uncharacterized protein n=1 Tax=Chlamydomonas schloesseri TaxID=2026947 RepID=A0A835WP24_9CHLO|nr:hypothetical protein HYH02_004590 [Chlamydomonas schloesseri]|eukprot:KAG2450753.1 hypothetical protein HYH02_004590 [Chlamydomonas schloesseri]
MRPRPDTALQQADAARRELRHLHDNPQAWAPPQQQQQQQQPAGGTPGHAAAGGGAAGPSSAAGHETAASGSGLATSASHATREGVTGTVDSKAHCSYHEETRRGDASWNDGLFLTPEGADAAGLYVARVVDRARNALGQKRDRTVRSYHYLALRF